MWVELAWERLYIVAMRGIARHGHLLTCISTFRAMGQRAGPAPQSLRSGRRIGAGGRSPLRNWRAAGQRGVAQLARCRSGLRKLRDAWPPHGLIRRWPLLHAPPPARYGDPMTSTPGAAQAHARGAACGLAAAALFGASAPLSKLLLPRVGLLMLAALLYLGAGLGLLAARMLGGRSGPARRARRPSGARTHRGSPASSDDA
jgi:hypothetical protein